MTRQPERLNLPALLLIAAVLLATWTILFQAANLTPTGT